ncbi:RNA-binding protein [Halobacteria archaeon AArc-m2/3/4]|uniref:RNA-binding protein n=1 Tax=Natronoglomus mannanivorans TaxID=2979990 RepID=A0AAP3E0T0_9EURY|nr:RNA-binding protein [Halobacteria archaeon AArc-xg1-1]MCU4972675.1 RNA-binding protein [Halobacteria archaeon AArc-m2/3/4]
MLQTGSLVIGITVGIVVLSWLVRRAVGRSRSRSGSRELTEAERESFERHRDAQGREPPVELGDVREIGVQEFTRHHSGERRALGKVEGFVIFVEDVPDDVEVADVIRVKVLSFNRGHTSATATFLERA